MEPMDDVIFVGLFIAMVGLAFGYVRLCARIVGDVEAPVAPNRDR
jgi:hypothetical protein